MEFLELTIPYFLISLHVFQRHISGLWLSFDGFYACRFMVGSEDDLKRSDRDAELCSQ